MKYFILLLSALLVFSASAGWGQGTPDLPVYTVADSRPDADFDADFDEEFFGGPAEEKLINDPFEPVNRGIFWVNDKLYFYVIKPVVRGYRLVVPRPARVSVGNVFSNLAAPIRAGNALLQLNFRHFGTEVYRFVINTTFGLGGLFDPAGSVAGVKPAIEDFGQTLGSYGAGHGFYLVLPIVGPSSLRDGIGSFVDSFADPWRYMGLETFEFIGVKASDVTNRLSLDRDTYEGIVRDAIDPYLFIRASYAQRRKAQVGESGYNINLLRGPLFDSDLLDPFEWFGF